MAAGMMAGDVITPKAAPAAEMLAEGWSLLPSHGFIQLVGPFWWREAADGRIQMAVWADARHENQAGVVQGGMIATLADRAMGFTCRRARPSVSQATIALDMRYLSPAPLGRLLVADCRLVRDTRHVAFVECMISAGDVLASTATAIFKRKAI